MLLRLTIRITGLFALVHLALAREPTVVTRVGKIEGFRYKTENGFEANVFLGIPYAKPPIGELRFEKPVPHEPFNHTLRAKKFSLSCPGHHDMDDISPTGEDCLTLNIIAPNITFKPEKPAGHPVAVFFHPGGFCIGSSAWHGYQAVADSLVSRGIVVVTLNYRLGFLGFASTGDSVMPGNLGLYDMTMALQWVHDHINAFNGDPDHVVAWGLSAGAASVGHLSLSPYSRHLMKYLIQMSGSPFSSWSTSDQCVPSTLKLALSVGCGTDSAEIKRCLKKKSLKHLIDATYSTGIHRKSTNLAMYQPRHDGDFLPNDYVEMIKMVEPKPTFMGSASDESVLFAVYNAMPTINGIGLTPEEIPSFDGVQLERLIREKAFSSEEFGDLAQPLADRAVQFFVHRDAPPTPTDPLFFVRRFADLVTDLQFFVPMLLELVEKRESGWPVFAYRNHYHQAHHFPPGTPMQGTIHGAELRPIFDFPIPHAYQPTDEDQMHRMVLLDALEKFIKTGDPSNETFIWPTGNKTSLLTYVRLHSDTEIQKSYDEIHTNFWFSLRRDFGDAAIRGIHYGFHGKSHGHEEF